MSNDDNRPRIVSPHTGQPVSATALVDEALGRGDPPEGFETWLQYDRARTAQDTDEPIPPPEIPTRNVPAPEDARGPVPPGWDSWEQFEAGVEGAVRQIDEGAATAAPLPMVTFDVRNVKSRRRRLAIAWAWIRIPYDIVVHGRAVVPDR